MRRRTEQGDLRSLVVGAVGVACICLGALLLHPAWRTLVGAVAGIALAYTIVRVGYASRSKTRRSGARFPAWGAGVGVFAAAIGIAAAENGDSGGVVLGFIGGFLLSLAVAQVVFRRITTS